MDSGGGIDGGWLMVERGCYGAYDEGYAPRAFRGSGTPTRMEKGFFVLLCLNPSLDELTDRELTCPWAPKSCRPGCADVGDREGWN